VFYCDVPGGETVETAFLPRLVVIDDPDTSPDPLDSSYPEWAVEIDAAYTEHDEHSAFNMSLVPAGQAGGTEFAYLYISGNDFFTDPSAMVKINAVTQTLVWLVADDDAWGANPIPPGFFIGASSVPTLSPFLDNLHFEPATFGNSFVEIWVIETQAPVTSSGAGHAWLRRLTCPRQTQNHGSTAYSFWQYDTADGAALFINENAPVNWHAANDPTTLSPPQYSYYWEAALDDIFTYNGLDLSFHIEGTEVLEYFHPIAGAPNSTLWLGFRRPHIYEDGQSGVDNLFEFESTVEATVGELDLTTDTYGFPFVAGDPLWSHTETAAGGGHPDSSPTHSEGQDMGVVCEGFDAIRLQGVSTIKWIALFTSSFLTDWIEVDPPGTGPGFGPYWQWRGAESYSVLVINGVEIETLTIRRNDNTGTLENNRDFYPQYIRPRVLQPTESAQGGGQRFVIFKRYPFDADEVTAEELESNEQLQWRLVCLNDSGIELWNLISEWPTAFDTWPQDHPDRTPLVYTSSDRYMYVTNFRMAVPGSDPARYYLDWEISHDGQILNPCRRDPRDTGTPLALPGTLLHPTAAGDYIYDCVKRSNSVGLSPAYEER
jgi:hypothetical protein